MAWGTWEDGTKTFEVEGWEIDVKDGIVTIFEPYTDENGLVTYHPVACGPARYDGNTFPNTKTFTVQQWEIDIIDGVITINEPNEYPLGIVCDVVATDSAEGFFNA